MLARYRRDFTPAHAAGRGSAGWPSGYASNWATTDAICGSADRSAARCDTRSWRRTWSRLDGAPQPVGPARVGGRPDPARSRRGSALRSAYGVARRLHGDEEDLIQKAVGWMLREAGKADPARLERYLRDNGPRIPRTTVRYAIERFPEPAPRAAGVTRASTSSARRPGPVDASRRCRRIRVIVSRAARGIPHPGLRANPWNLIRCETGEADALEPDPVETGEGRADMSEFTTAFPEFAQSLRRRPAGRPVPMREIALSGGEPPLRVYDTSGPQDHDVDATGCRSCASRGWRRGASRGAGRARRSRSCTTRGRARSRRRWSSSRSARGCRPSSCATRSRAAARSSRPTSITSSSSR